MQRAKRASRLVQSIARWAITLGSAGSIVGGAALLSVLLGREVIGNQHGLLMLAAILLSVAFILAPFVRNTFGLAASADGDPAGKPRTLLDEMRETPADQPADQPRVDSAIAPTPDPQPEPEAEVPVTTVLTSRLVTGAYVVFAAVLLTILWALQAR